MKKAFVCLLALMLVLVAFSSCDNQTTTPNPESGTTTTTPEPGTSTEPPKEATETQNNALKHVYGGTLQTIDANPEGVTAKDGGYVLTNAKLIIGETDFGIFNGTFKDTKKELSMNITWINQLGARTSVVGTADRDAEESIWIINGEKCIILKAVIDECKVPTASE